MNDIEDTGYSSSPSGVGNFVIDSLAEKSTIQDFQTDLHLLQFLESEKCKATNILCETNESFFPRAFTDLNLIENEIDNDRQYLTSSLVDRHTCLQSKNKDLDKRNMAERNSGRVDSSFQPDVITSTSHQRPGPDGSPAFVPSASQGFVQSSNLSDTGELFAPVRHLTFSDIDQNSQIDESYVNNSRLVSTPNKSERKPGHYDYSSIKGARFQTIENNENLGDDSDTSDSDNMTNGIHGSSSPQFRQLEGEADNDLAKTGPLHPSAHGLSKEFMDNFVGKTGYQALIQNDGDIFSPLRANPFGVEEDPERSVTPPLHSPGPGSPYARVYGSQRGKKSPRAERTSKCRPSPKGQAHPEQDPDEIQFAMSPNKHSDFHPFDQEMLGLGSLNQARVNREKFFNGNDASVQHAFKSVEQHSHKFNPAAVPKNLDEYFEQVTNEEFISGQFRDSYIASHERRERGYDGRQGDGSDLDLDERPQRFKSYDNTDPYSMVSNSAFEHRYLQRTQVSVKLPQATYDTMSANISQDERFAGGDHERQAPEEGSNMPPDVAIQGAEGGHSAKLNTRPSPGKMMDLLQNESSKLNNNINNVNDGNRENEKVKVSEVLSEKQHHQSVKSRDNSSNNSRSSSVSDNGEQKPTRKHDTEESIDTRLLFKSQTKENDSKPSQLPQSSASSGSSSHLTQQSKPIQAGIQYNFPGAQSQLPSKQTQLPSNHSQLPGNQSQLPINQSQLPSNQSQEASNQSQQPVSSRLLQETVSQRNKTTQKFVSSAPAISKPVTSHLNKDFKKPFDVAPKNQNVACSGSRKVVTSETGPKFKASDKTKPKSVSSESLNQRQKNAHIQPNIMTNHTSDVVSQPKNNVQKVNQSAGMLGQGHLNKGHQRQSTGKGQTGVASHEGHNGSIHSEDEEGQGRVVTQVETTSPVPVEQPRNQVTSRQHHSFIDTSLDMKGMEEVRQQLQGMMRMSYDHMSVQDRSQYEHSDIVAGFGVEFADQHRHLEQSWNMIRKSGEEEFAENFPSFTSQYFTDSGNVSRSDTSVHTENQRLRDMLEKERYRRKHCEQYIQQLNVKLLETQQQVAVAVSTDKRKDIMIEQLDKQLARVMEGWKKRDLEKDAVLEEIQKEKEAIENNLKRQQEMISNFEHDMSAAVDALRQEKEKASQHAAELQDKIEESARERAHAEELLDAEREKADLLQQECDSLREGRETLDKKLDQMQRRLHREQDDWFQREQELLQRIDEVSEKSNKILQAERAKNEEQGKLAEEIMEQYQVANTKVKKLELELDDALREKESIKVEMGIMEAKFENAQRVLEADMHSTMEKQIAEQIADVQRRHEKSLDEVGDKHRQQMLDMSKKHGKEMEKQLATFRDEIQRKEEDYRKQMHELENRLMEYRNENAELKRSKQKLESTRIEILTKLQYAMQTQWNEALSLLSATPQRRPTQSRTLATEDDAASAVPSAAPVVNFSLYTPNRTNENTAFKPPANQNTPPRSSSNQSTPPKQFTANHQSPSSSIANQLSPVARHLSNQNRGHVYSPGGESVISHSTERDPGDHMEASVETAALSHLKQFQDYMNSFTKTPEWIASINSQLESANFSADTPHVPAHIEPWAPPRLPSPPELAALLSTHLHNIQQQHFMPRPAVSMNLSGASFSQPNSILANQRQSVHSASTSLPPSFSNESMRSHVQHRENNTRTPPIHGSLMNPVELSQSNLSLADRSVVNGGFGANSSMYSEKGARMLWEGAPGVSRAVPLHPPHQGEHQGQDLHDEQQSVLSALHGGSMRGYFQGGQSFSPPTKQNKEDDLGSMEDLANQSNRLNEDYSELTERLEQHGSHQQELQHYIHMLLNRSPGEVPLQNQNDSMFSQDNEELDLNDTAQAAQLQRELDRIQELRHKQEAANSKFSEKPNSVNPQLAANTSVTKETGDSKILSQEQLAEVTRLLNQVKGQGQSTSPQVMELLQLLKHAQLDKSSKSEPKKGSRSHVSNHGDRHKGTAVGVRRNVHFNPGKGVEASKQQVQDGNKGDKPSSKSTQPKKVERKVAGAPANKGTTEKVAGAPANKGSTEKVTGAPTNKGTAEKGPKPAAWK